MAHRESRARLIEKRATGRKPSILTGKRVVIVEDEGITVLQLEHMMALGGLRVVGTAMNGMAAAEIILESRPDIVLMDVRLPMMNGLDAARRVLETYRPCVVMLTSYCNPEMREEAARIGAWGYLLKPLQSSVLLTDLENIYARYAAAVCAGNPGLNLRPMVD